MVRPRVIVSVVSGARPEHIVSCVASLGSAARDPSMDMLIVATVNGAHKALRSRIEAVASGGGYAGSVEVLENPTPLGFAANHNRVMVRFSADYYLIANDDVVVTDDAVGRLVRFMDDARNSKVAVVSPVLRNPDGSLQQSTTTFPTIPRTLLSMSGLKRSRSVQRILRAVGALPSFGGGRSGYWAHDRTTVVDTLSGAFVLVRAAVLADVGLMDEVSVAGGEDVEWHKRMKDRGWSVALYSEAHVVHMGHETVGRGPEHDLDYARGWLNYFVKHASGPRRRSMAVSSWTVWAIRFVVAAARDDTDERVRARGGMELSRAVWFGTLDRGLDRAQQGT